MHKPAGSQPPPAADVEWTHIPTQARNTVTSRNTLVLTVLALLVVGAGAVALARKIQGPVVEVVRAQAGPFEHSIVVSGRVQAPNRIEIGSVITGRVEKVLVEEGATVKHGQPLILLETRELKAVL